MENNKNKNMLNKIVWIENYGENLLNGVDELNLEDINRSAKFAIKINQMNKLCKDIIESKLDIVNFYNFKYNQIVKVYFHSLEFIEKLKGKKISTESILRSYFSKDIKDKLEKVRSSGASTRCPTCDQHVKEYKKSLSSNSARFLFSLVSISRTKPEGWVHYSDCIYNSRNYPEVAYWGLAHTQRDESKEKKTSGLWKPTRLGIDFINNKVKIPKYVHVYNSKVVKFDDKESISIIDAFGNKFSYEDLMREF